MWDALAQLLGNSTARGRTEPFTQSMARLGLMYKRWAMVKKQLTAHNGKVHSAARALGNITGAGSDRSLVRGYEYIEMILKEANDLNARDDEGKPLQRIEARDLIPTQKLEKILER
jgi:hypothetical protein